MHSSNVSEHIRTTEFCSWNRVSVISANTIQYIHYPFFNCTVSIQLFFLFLFGFAIIIMNTKLADEVGSLLDVFCIRIQHLSMKESVHTLQVRTRGLKCNFFYKQPHTGQFTTFFLLLTFCSDERRPTVNKGSKTKSFNTYCIFLM